MSKILVGIVVTLLAAIATAGVVVYTGAFDVAADTPHAAVTYRLIAFARERSIARRIEDIAPPGDLGDIARVRRGAGNYAAMCGGCHLEPGIETSELRMGLYPQPPNLTKLDADRSHEAAGAARRFWIIKHGIKASGMPAWSKGGMEDAEVWDLVAFVQRLPKISAPEYRELVESSEGHSHAGKLSAADHSNVPKGVPDRQESGHSDGEHHPAVDRRSVPATRKPLRCGRGAGRPLPNWSSTPQIRSTLDVAQASRPHGEVVARSSRLPHRETRILPIVDMDQPSPHARYRSVTNSEETGLGAIRRGNPCCPAAVRHPRTGRVSCPRRD